MIDCLAPADWVGFEWNLSGELIGSFGSIAQQNRKWRSNTQQSCEVHLGIKCLEAAILLARPLCELGRKTYQRIGLTAGSSILRNKRT
jgi:hypothetical protein